MFMALSYDSLSLSLRYLLSATYRLAMNTTADIDWSTVGKQDGYEQLYRRMKTVDCRNIDDAVIYAVGCLLADIDAQGKACMGANHLTMLNWCLVVYGAAVQAK